MYAREIDGEVLTFIVSGMLWRNSLIMMDAKTQSWWSHITGECFEGAFEGRTLEALPSVQTTWAEWRNAHPETKLLVKSREVKSSHYESYFADESRAGLFRTQWLMDRMSSKAKVHGVTRGILAAAVTDDHLREHGEVEVTLGDEVIRFVRGDDGGVRAYVGEDEIPVGVFFWFAWSAFYPNTEVVG